MAGVYGLSGELSDNIYVFATLTAAGTSEAIEVQASMFTFQHVIVGASITYKEQGSLDGTNWYDLADAKTKGAGTFCEHYSGIMARYIRINATTLNSGHTLSTTVACT